MDNMTGDTTIFVLGQLGGLRQSVKHGVFN